jgi:hypothetical protein
VVDVSSLLGEETLMQGVRRLDCRPAVTFEVVL